MLDGGKLVVILSFMVDKFNVLLITLFSEEKSICLCCWSKLSVDVELPVDSSIKELPGMFNSLLELIIDEEDDEDKFMFAAELVWPVVFDALVAATALELVVGLFVGALSKDSVEFDSMAKC